MKLTPQCLALIASASTSWPHCRRFLFASATSSRTINLESYKKIADIIDISGGVESSGIKDISKIEIFLNKVKKVNDEN